jgi:hypothetical protein
MRTTHINTIQDLIAYVNGNSARQTATIRNVITALKIKSDNIIVQTIMIPPISPLPKQYNIISCPTPSNHVNRKKK